MKKTLKAKYYAIINDSQRTRDFYENQTLVHFEKKWFLEDELSKNPKEIDLKYLKQFEQKYGINLWLVAAAEKEFYPQYNKYHKFDRREILVILELECKFYEKILLEIKPNFIITGNVIDRHTDYLLYLMCRALKIDMLSLETPRLSKLWFITNKLHTINYTKPNTPTKLKTSEELLNELKESSMYKYGYEYIKPRKVSIVEKIKQLILYRRSTKYQTYLVSLSRKKSFIPKLYSLKQKFLVKKRSSYINKNFEKIIPKNEKFLYFPLHSEPEKRTLLHAPFYFNQIHVIQTISKSLPIDYFLYVKEHPNQKLLGYRKIDFYKEITYLPNVKLFHDEVKNSELISNSSAVIVIAGSSAFEAAFYGKPSIVFSKTEYSHLPSVYIVNKIDDLPNIIRNAINHQVDLSSISDYTDFIRKKFIYFDDAAFGIDFQNKFYEGISKFKSVSTSDIDSFLANHDSFLGNLASAHISIIKDYLHEKENND